MKVNNSYYDNLIPKLRSNFSPCIPNSTDLWPNEISISVIIPIIKQNVEYKLEFELYLKPDLDDKYIPFVEKIIRICYKCTQRKILKKDCELESYLEKLGPYYSRYLALFTCSLDYESE